MAVRFKPKHTHDIHTSVFQMVSLSWLVSSIYSSKINHRFITWMLTFRTRTSGTSHVENEWCVFHMRSVSKLNGSC